MNHVVGANRRYTMLLHGATADAVDATRAADHLGADLDHDLGDDGVDLAGHDRGALLQLRQPKLGEAGAGAGAHQREIVGDLREGDGNDLQRTG